MQWNQTFYPVEGSFYDLVQTSDGDFALIGTLDDKFPIVLKMNENGTVLWNQTYTKDLEPSNSFYLKFQRIIKTLDGGFVFVAGTNIVKIDSLGRIEWNQVYNGWGVAVIQTKDNEFVTGGWKTGFGEPGDWDMWLGKFDTNGNELWVQTYGGKSRDDAKDLIQTGDGGFALAGCTYSYGAGGYDIWLVKTDEDGTVLWTQTWGGEDNEEAVDLIQAGDGNFVLAGSRRFRSGEYDVTHALLVKLIPGYSSDKQSSSSTNISAWLDPLLILAIILAQTIVSKRKRN